MTPNLDSLIDFNIWLRVFTQTQDPVKKCTNCSCSETVRDQVREALYDLLDDIVTLRIQDQVHELLSKHELFLYSQTTC